MRFLGNFLLVWFGIVVVIFGVAFVQAILADAYTFGGPRGLAIALAILAAFPAFFFALWLRNRGVELYQAPRPRIERWIMVVALTGLAATTIKAGWNIMTDPPGVMRPCAFCSPYVPYKSPQPPG
jgi:hypothetical protein